MKASIIKASFPRYRGAADYKRDLSVNKYHKGTLQYVRKYEWEFWNNKETMKEFTDYFADVITAWYE